MSDCCAALPQGSSQVQKKIHRLCQLHLYVYLHWISLFYVQVVTPVWTVHTTCAQKLGHAAECICPLPCQTRGNNILRRHAAVATSLTFTRTGFRRKVRLHSIIDTSWQILWSFSHELQMHMPDKHTMCDVCTEAHLDKRRWSAPISNT